jgi:serine/threonine protein kinase
LCSGDVLDNRYRLTGPIATGGMGEVWRAVDVSLGRMVAVKLLRPKLLADPEFDARFQAEARTMAALTHPHVVNVYDYGHAPPTSGGAPYLVMSYVHGVPLSQRIAEAGRLSVAETGSVLIQAAAALHAAHRSRIVHCDVKPANLLVASDGGLTLVDFGVARPATVTTGRTGRTVIGTALYMAPEQVTGRPVSPATDIYALGGRLPLPQRSAAVHGRHPVGDHAPAPVRRTCAASPRRADRPADAGRPSIEQGPRTATPLRSRLRPRGTPGHGASGRDAVPGGGPLPAARPAGAAPVDRRGAWLPSPPCWSAVR